MLRLTAVSPGLKRFSAAIEADHIIGDLLARGGARASDYPLLQIAYAHLRTYEARRQREKSAPAG